MMITIEKKISVHGFYKHNSALNGLIDKND